MELRRGAGLRALPDPSGPAPRARGPRYLVAHACFGCRLSFKRAPRTDGTSPQCPSCGQALAEMGRGFRAPVRRNIERWKVAELLYQAGFRFPSTTRRESPALPTRLTDVRRFIEENACHPYRSAI